MVAIAVDIPAQLIPVRRITMLLVRRAVVVLVLVPGRLAVHFPLVLPQPLTLPLRTPLLLAGRVTVLRLLIMVFMMMLALFVRLARRMRRRGCIRG